MTQDLKTKIAEAINADLQVPPYPVLGLPSRAAQAALQAIHDAGYRLLPRDPTARVLADAMMNAVTYDPDAKDYAITGAVLELLPPTGHPDARLVIAELSRDYRAMIRASSPAGAS